MHNLLPLIAIDVLAFATTNVDDLFLLLGFFSEFESLPRHVLIGQYIGMRAIIATSLALSLLSFVTPLSWIGLIGLLPVAIGVTKIITGTWASLARPESELPNCVPPSSGTVLEVAIVTASLGGDNVTVYAPLLALQLRSEEPLQLSASWP